MLDVSIRNGTVVSDGNVRKADIGIHDGRIVELGAQGSLDSAPDYIDAEGCYVLPGVVDVHFHCRAPSRPDRGDFSSETRAAAVGGVTTVCEMPISDPACSTPEVFHARRALLESAAYVDVALYAGGAVKSTREAEAMADAGAVGFKLFTHQPSPERSREFQGLWATTEFDIYTALKAIAPTGLVCTVHAENDALLSAFGQFATLDGVPHRPPLIESTAIAMIGALGADAGARIHIAHVTSREAVDSLRGARASGCDITGETCPQYLVFDRTFIERFGAFAKVSPPLRDLDDVEYLWRSLEEGHVNIIASDHAPFLPAEKSEATYASAPSGLPTVETMLPIMVDAALRERIPLALAVDMLTARPAARFGLYPKKGTISPGADADIVIVDPTRSRALSVDQLTSRAGRCGLVYEGMNLRGLIVRTLLRGHTIVQDGNVREPQVGRFLKPADALSVKVV